MDIALRVDKFFRRYNNKSLLSDIDKYNIFKFVTNYRKLRDHKDSNEALFYIVDKLNEFSDIFEGTAYEYQLINFLGEVAINYDLEYCLIFNHLGNIKHILYQLIVTVMDRIRNLCLMKDDKQEKILLLQKNIVYLYKLIGNNHSYYDLDKLFEEEYDVLLFIESLYLDDNDFKNIFEFYDKVIVGTKYKKIYLYYTPKEYKKYYWFKNYKLKLINRSVK